MWDIFGIRVELTLMPNLFVRVDSASPHLSQTPWESDGPVVRSLPVIRYGSGREKLRLVRDPRFAEVVAFLVSSASLFMPGSVFLADGGLTSKCY